MEQPDKLPISTFPKGDTHGKQTRHSNLNVNP